MTYCSPAVLAPGRIHAPRRCWVGSANCATRSRPPLKRRAPANWPVAAAGALPATVTARPKRDVSVNPPVGGAGLAAAGGEYSRRSGEPAPAPVTTFVVAFPVIAAATVAGVA